MPLEELLALYRYAPAAPSEPSDRPDESSTSNNECSTNDAQSGKSSVADAPTERRSRPSSVPPCSPPSAEQSARASKLGHLIGTTGELCYDQSDEDDEDDEDYDEEDRTADWRKSIQVGEDHQAQVPDSLSPYPTESSEKDAVGRLLWTPSGLSDEAVQLFLKAFTGENGLPAGGRPGAKPAQAIPDQALPLGAHVRDNEEALQLLLQCDHNVELALRRKPTAANPAPERLGTERMRPWAEDECREFEEGLKLHGKDFYAIQQARLTGRPVGELVHFYYLWKKTERHDLFAGKWRIEKKKYSLHPGITDYMDKFLDEQENLAMHSQPDNLPASFAVAQPAPQTSHGTLLSPKATHTSNNASAPAVGAFAAYGSRPSPGASSAGRLNPNVGRTDPLLAASKLNQLTERTQPNGQLPVRPAIAENSSPTATGGPSSVSSSAAVTSEL